jgi:hypothetical protein
MPTNGNSKIAGVRQSTAMGSASYRTDKLYPYAKAFTECAHNILLNESQDIFSDPKRAIMVNSQVKESLREFFCNDFVNEADETKTPEEIEDEKQSVEEQFENDMQAMMENTVQSDYSPMVGLAAPIHKLILMNNVFSQGGGIQKVTAVQPSFTISLERRILTTPDGEEIDMWLDQNKIADAIDATAPTVMMELDIPHMEEDTDIIGELGGTTLDKVSMESKIAGIYVENVYFAEGDHLPDENGWYTNKGEVATAETAGTKNVWFKVNFPFSPTYGGPNRLERTISRPVTIKYKADADGTINIISDIIFASLNDNKLTVTAVKGKIKKVRFAAKLDTSNAMLEECSVSWKVDTDYVEIYPTTPINTTISPEEVKDVSAFYDVNQVTKIISITKTALSEYKDKKIYNYLNEAYERGDERNTFTGEFDFAVPEGYALDWVTHRSATFMDYLDDYVTKMLQVLNDSNMTVSIYGDPRIVRKITPKDYTYQAPANIGPVTLDYTQTIVNTSDNRVYNFLGSDKMRNTNELMVILNPRNSDRICFRIYDYQLYISNEIRNSANPALPAIHAFDRWRMYSMFEILGKINILNPSGMRNRDTFVN